MTTAMHEAGYVRTDRNPDHVVLRRDAHLFEAITTARFGSGTSPLPAGSSRFGYQALVTVPDATEDADESAPEWTPNALPDEVLVY